MDGRWIVSVTSSAARQISRGRTAHFMPDGHELRTLCNKTFEATTTPKDGAKKCARCLAKR